MKPTRKQIWTIAYPILISLLMENMIGLTDTAFLGRVGEVELGASALGSVYYLVIFMLGFGFGIGAQILIARRNGEKAYDLIGPLFQQGLLFLLSLATVMFVISHTFTPMVLRSLISSDEVYEAAVSYTNWRVFGFFFAFVAIMFRAFFVGITNTKTLTLNSIVMVLSNVVLNYVLVFGKLGLPAMGIAGAAIASSASEMISMVFFIVYTRLRIDHRKYGLFRFAGCSSKLLRGMLNVSVWTMIQMFVAISTWFFFFIAVEHLGERPLAVTNIIRSVSGIVFVIVSSFASTASTLVSNQMGAGQPELVAGTTRRIVGMCYLIVIPLLALFAVFPELILRIYTDEQSLIDGSVASLRVMLSSYLISVPAFIRFNVVSGTGNTRSALMLELATLSVYAIYTVWIVLYRHSDVALCWTTEHVYALVLLLLASLYLKKARWQDRKI